MCWRRRRIFWHTDTVVCPPGLAGQPAGPAPYTEAISRIATYGSAVRQLFAEGRTCDVRLVRSNIVADADYVYFLTSSGLQRLSTSANPGDRIADGQRAGGRLRRSWPIGGDQTYYIVRSGNNSYIGYVLKSNNQRVNAHRAGQRRLQSIGRRRVSSIISLNGNLIRLNPGVDAASRSPPASPATSRRASASSAACSIRRSVSTRRTSMSAEYARTMIYNNLNDTLGTCDLHQRRLHRQCLQAGHRFGQLFLI